MALCKWLCLLSAAVILLVFHRWVNTRQPEPYMDELFHVPQAMEMCDAIREKRWPVYHPDITTPPGLYSIPALLLSPFHYAVDVCTTPWLRAWSALMSFLLLPVLAAIIRLLRANYCDTKIAEEQYHWLAALLIWLNPVSLFYSSLFYTDTSSTMFILLAWYFSLKRQTFASAIAGLMASSVRQTNVVWHAFIAFSSIIDGIQRINKEQGVGGYSVHVVTMMVRNHVWHVIVGVVYVLLLLLNGGVVIGDRTRHEHTIHHVMFCYLLAYHGVSYSIFQVWTPVATYRRLKSGVSFKALTVLAAIASLTSGLVIASGDRVHTFTMSDNRHFTFYIYRRWLLKSALHRLALVPVYSWALWSIYLEMCSLKSQSPPMTQNGHYSNTLHTALEWCVDAAVMCCGMISVVPSGLLEVRYFVIASLFLTLRRASRAAPGGMAGACAMIAALILVNTLLIFVFAELPFERATDNHMPMDHSPGRFMF